MISIHGPRVGADIQAGKRGVCGGYFNPRPPCGGRHKCTVNMPVYKGISIHGPRVGADTRRSSDLPSCIYFNPRPPCGGRQILPPPDDCSVGFQSTAPVWGPTELRNYSGNNAGISIHGPRVGADAAYQQPLVICVISIHGPRVGADRIFWPLSKASKISIHGPRVGADESGGGCDGGGKDFNPRPPCGGRLPVEYFQAVPFWDFNPRPPCGGRRSADTGTAGSGNISIHGPRVGAD